MRGRDRGPRAFIFAAGLGALVSGACDARPPTRIDQAAGLASVHRLSDLTASVTAAKSSLPSSVPMPVSNGSVVNIGGSGRLYFYVRIKNTGGSTVAGGVVHTKVLITRDGSTLVCESPLESAALPPGGVWSHAYTIVGGNPIATVDVTVQADSEGKLAETSEFNNAASFSCTVHTGN